MVTEDENDGGFAGAPLGCETGEPVRKDVGEQITLVSQATLDVCRGDTLRWLSVTRFSDGDVVVSFNQLGSSSTVNVSVSEAVALGKLLTEVAS